jgi:hypothetical protein
MYMTAEYEGFVYFLHHPSAGGEAVYISDTEQGTLQYVLLNISIV